MNLFLRSMLALSGEARTRHAAAAALTRSRGRATTAVLAIAAAVLALTANDAAAQAYPERLIRVILPGGPGGPNDLLIRTAVQPISASIGQPVVIDYRAGAGGNIGMEAAARAAPDGYTLVVGALGQQVLNPLIDPKLPYNPDRDFVPIVLLARFPYALVVHPSVPATNARDLIALLKANPGKYNYGSHGHGTTSHVASELFKATVGVQVAHVPYKSDAAAVTDLLGGQVQLMFNVASSVGRHVDAGSLRGIATASRQRVPSIPNLQTFEEQGLPGLAAETWYSLLAPVGTPPRILERLNAEVNKVISNPATRASLSQVSAIAAGGTMAEAQAFIDSEKIKWKPIVAASGAKVD